MMISLIVVALVGIGFTRLTMLALELRDNYEDANGEEPVDIGRKRVETHDRMVRASKPDYVVVRGDNRYEAAPSPVGDCLGTGEDSYAAVLASAAEAVGVAGLFGSAAKSDAARESDARAASSASFSIFGGAVESAPANASDEGSSAPPASSPSATERNAPAADEEDARAAPDEPEARPSTAGDFLGDPTDVCTICFEKAKNAVLLSCGHGGLCYSCSIDVCVTSGHCPFCRKEIGQIVTVGIGQVTYDAHGNQLIPVIGPK